MSKYLFLLFGVVVFSETNGTPLSNKPTLTMDDSDDEFSVDDWSELDVIYSGDAYREGMQVPEKRANRDSLMRRSTLDKNFMRFGRSGFFPADRCCKQKDLIGFAEDYDSVSDPISLTKKDTDSNFMRFGRGGTDNLMRFRRGGDNFMRFGRGGSDNFMRFGRPEKDKGNFMRFGRDNKGNFMRFGRDDKGNFMRFGRGKDDSFMRFGRGDKDNFIRFGRGDPDDVDDNLDDEETLSKRDTYKLGKNPINFIRYGKSGGKDDSFIRFGKSGRNGTNFLRFVRESARDDTDGDAKTNLTTRRKRMTTDSLYGRIPRSPELMEDVLPEKKRSGIEDSIAKPNLLKFISLINTNQPNWDGDKSFLQLAQRNPVLKPNTETYKRKQDGSGFIRFG